MNVTESIVIAAAPDAVWEVGGDVGNIADWVVLRDRLATGAG